MGGVENSFAIGTGSAFDSAVGNSRSEDENRRKRDLNQYVVRSKRQTEGFDNGAGAGGAGAGSGAGAGAGAGGAGANGGIDKFKEMFGKIMETAKQMMQKMKEVMGSKQNPSKGNYSSDVENFQ